MYSEYTVHSHCGFPERFTIYFTSHIEAVERFTYCERLNAFKMPTASRDHLFLGCSKGFLFFFFLPTVFRLLRVTNAVIHCGYVLLHWQYGLHVRCLQWHIWKLSSSGNPTNSSRVWYLDYNPFSKGTNYVTVLFSLPRLSFCHSSPADKPYMRWIKPKCFLFCERQLMATLSAAVPLRPELILHQLRESDAIYFENRTNLPSVTNLEYHCWKMFPTFLRCTFFKNC